jgi:hypothetical protein
MIFWRKILAAASNNILDSPLLVSPAELKTSELLRISGVWEPS